MNDWTDKLGPFNDASHNEKTSLVHNDDEYDSAFASYINPAFLQDS